MDALLFFQDAGLVGQKKTKNTKNQIEAQIQNNKKKRQRTSGFWSNCTN